MRQLIGKGLSRLTPQLCRQCEGFASEFLGGAEIELTLLFADVRCSTPLVEQIAPAKFGQLISRVFAVAAEVLSRHQAMVDKLLGDRATGMLLPGFTGPKSRQVALAAVRELLRATGHERAEGPWIPVGIGIHTGVAFIGSVGSAGARDVTVLGDPANVAARLSFGAAAGEILVTHNAVSDALQIDGSETRKLELKGKSQAVGVYVVK